MRENDVEYNKKGGDGLKRLTPQSSVAELPGVGATREKQLSRLGINTVNDLIYLFPRAYEKRGNVKKLAETSHGMTSSTVLTVATEVKNASLRKGLTVSKFHAFDESGKCEISFFNAPYVKDIFKIGAEFRFYGKIEHSRTKYHYTNPSYEPVIEGRELPPLTPIYPLTEGITSKFLDKLCKTAIDEVLYAIRDPLPDDIRIKYSLPVLSYALKNAHFPESDEALARSLSRLAFDEMLVFGIGISLSTRYKSDFDGAVFKKTDFKPLTDLLPYELTGAQKNAINDIYRDTVFASADGGVRPMARILVGDVGSGKTICAIAAIYLAVKSGYQAAFMAPTEILARQHYKDISALFEKLGISVKLLIGATPKKEKTNIYESLKNGETDLVIGTHALLSDNVDFRDLGLVITDEQHRFGVKQRAVLKDKSRHAHLLVMSATPIPRTLALTMYGDLDVSRINEMPKGRQRVDTFVVDESYRARLNSFIEKQVLNGGQCYIVCPSIEQADADDDLYSPSSISEIGEYLYRSAPALKNTQEYTENLRQSLPNLSIASLHGKMRSVEKDAVMQDFASGKIDVLVSTTVIEVGVNVPNASLMIIENADRFGLAQLHQLRGRVGRGSRKSYCVLVSDLNTPNATSRLEIMRTTYDGFEIAEKDLILRGPGDFFATVNDDTLRQSGGFDFKLARLCDDTKLLEGAFSTAKALIQKDPGLISPENEELRRIVLEKISPINSTIS